MRIAVNTELVLAPIVASAVVLNVGAAKNDHQIISNEKFVFDPATSVEHHEMPESGVRYTRVNLDKPAILRYSADIDTRPVICDPQDAGAVAVSALPLSVLPHLLASRYCQSDRLTRYAAREFSNIPTGHDCVTAICNWIYQNIEYVAGSSDVHTSVHDTLVSRAGVCRDFAHLGIAFCRALNIPARFLSCYAYNLQPPDFHAVFEAYLGGRWFLFDPTRQVPLEGLVKIGAGRDAADVAFTTIFGAIELMKPIIEVSLPDGEVLDIARTPAISISTI